MLSLQVSPTAALDRLGRHARSKPVHSEAVQVFALAGHVQSLTQHVSPAPHISGFEVHDELAAAVAEQPAAAPEGAMTSPSDASPTRARIDQIPRARRGFTFSSLSNAQL